MSHAWNACGSHIPQGFKSPILRHISHSEAPALGDRNAVPDAGFVFLLLTLVNLPSPWFLQSRHCTIRRALG